MKEKRMNDLVDHHSYPEVCSSHTSIHFRLKVGKKKQFPGGGFILYTLYEVATVRRYNSNQNLKKITFCKARTHSLSFPCQPLDHVAQLCILDTEQACTFQILASKKGTVRSTDFSCLMRGIASDSYDPSYYATDAV